MTGLARFALVTALTAATSVTVGCQRIPGEDSDDGNRNPDSMSAGNFEEGGGETFLEGGGSDESGEGGDEEIEGCDPVAQLGCEGDQKCTVTKSGSDLSYVCVDDQATADLLGSCNPALASGLDGCPAGAACLGQDGAHLCVPLCRNDNDCGGSLCVQDPFDDVPHCAAVCSPFEPSCTSPLSCRRQGDQYGCAFARPEDVGGQGAQCILRGDSGCAEGLACIAGALLPGCTDDRCCASLCDLSAGMTCPQGTTCAPALDAPGPGFEDVGACFVPS